MNLKESTDKLRAYLDLDRMPVGIKFLKTKNDYDNFDADTRENKITYCNSIHFASMGHKLKLSDAHQACGKGAVAVGLRDEPKPMANGMARYKFGAYDSLETSKDVADKMDFIKEDFYGYAAMPLDEFKEDPDVVIVISKSYNVMRLIQGYAYKHGNTAKINTVGLQALCRDLTSYVYNEDTINISFLCPGTRLVANWKQDELGFATSFSAWYDIVEGIIKTTNPFERDKNKGKILEKLPEDEKDSIEFGKNYDTGSYEGGKVEE